MRKNYLLLTSMFISLAGTAQLNIQSGATFFIQTGATVTVQGDVNSSSDIQGGGLLQLKGTALQNLNMNGFSVNNVEIDNSSNVAFGGSAMINTSLLFTNGKFQIGNYNLTIGSTGAITGADNTKFVVTNGSGRLVKNSLGSTAFTFPVGFDATTYNPLAMTQNGTADNMGVRVLQNVQAAGTTGSAFVKEVVDASWEITEAVAGGSNLDVTATWTGTDELSGFNRTKTGISLYDGTTWDLTNTQTATAAGTGPYTISRSALTATGVLAVGTRPVLTPLLVSPKVWLQGPYNLGIMGDNLRVSGLIPTTEPYSTTTNFAHLGSGGAETVPSAAFTASGTATDDLVDWVFVSLHDATTGLPVATRAAFIDRDGDIVDFDGTNTKTPYVNMAGMPAGNYYVSVKHRNHLGVRSLNSFALSRTSTTTLDFRTNLALAYPGAVANNPMATLATGVYGLWGGNANSDGQTRKSGSGNVNDYSTMLAYLGASSIISNVYRREDFNMDGNVRKSGSGNVNDYSKFLSVLNGLTIISQAY